MELYSWPAEAASQPSTLPVRGLVVEAEHRKHPPGLAEIAPAETAGADYGEVAGTRGQHLSGEVRGRYMEVKIAHRLVIHPRSHRRPHGFKTCKEIWKSAADHLYEGTHCAHHHEAVPKAATAHQVRGNPPGRLLPKASDI